MDKCAAFPHSPPSAQAAPHARTVINMSNNRQVPNTLGRHRAVTVVDKRLAAAAISLCTGRALASSYHRQPMGPRPLASRCPCGRTSRHTAPAIGGCQGTCGHGRKGPDEGGHFQGRRGACWQAWPPSHDATHALPARTQPAAQWVTRECRSRHYLESTCYGERREDGNSPGRR